MGTNYSILNIRTDQPESGGVIIYWLGGSGFAFKFSTGEIVCIDPYLSDTIDVSVGFKRLSLAPVKAEDLHFDHLLFTHDHGDHLDIGSIDAMMESNPKCHIIAPECCAEYLNSKRIAFESATPGATFKTGSIDIKVIDADHAELCPTAVGYLIKYGENTIYFTGDTAYNDAIMAPVIATTPDIVIPCINGAFGNLSEEEAATLVAKCKTKIAIPSHFWLFAEHGGSPEEFRNSVKAKSPDTQTILFTPGVGVCVNP